jgi:hypothetical protein
VRIGDLPKRAALGIVFDMDMSGSGGRRGSDLAFPYHVETKRRQRRLQLIENLKTLRCSQWSVVSGWSAVSGQEMQTRSLRYVNHELLIRL